MTDEQPRRRRRAVGPPGAKPTVDEPLIEVPDTTEADDRRSLERYLADRPPHHEAR